MALLKVLPVCLEICCEARDAGAQSVQEAQDEACERSSPCTAAQCPQQQSNLARSNQSALFLVFSRERVKKYAHTQIIENRWAVLNHSKSMTHWIRVRKRRPSTLAHPVLSFAKIMPGWFVEMRIDVRPENSLQWIAIKCERNTLISIGFWHHYASLVSHSVSICHFSSFFPYVCNPAQYAGKLDNLPQPLGDAAMPCFSSIATARLWPFDCKRIFSKRQRTIHNIHGSVAWTTCWIKWLPRFWYEATPAASLCHQSTSKVWPSRIVG